MTILADHQIRDLANNFDMITPFVDSLTEKGVVSYGLSSFGYDVRIGYKARLYTNLRTAIVDPKAITDSSFVDVEPENGVFTIPPHSFMLAATLETISMPRWVTGLVTNKSTYARVGIVAPSCVLEAGWKGTITLEIANQTPSPARVYAGEGIAQLLFFVGASPDLDYAQRKGKYQGQVGITLPKVKE